MGGPTGGLDELFAVSLSPMSLFSLLCVSLYLSSVTFSSTFSLTSSLSHSLTHSHSLTLSVSLSVSQSLSRSLSVSPPSNMEAILTTQQTVPGKRLFCLQGKGLGAKCRKTEAHMGKSLDNKIDAVFVH